MKLSACKKKGLLLFFLLQGILLLSAQNYLVNTRKFTESDGLSHNQVNCFYQDRDGFMWIGTKYGLNRFDGHEFRWFTREENGLGSNFISEIYEDEAGWLWLVHSEERFGEMSFFNIDLFHPQTFSVISFEQKMGPENPFRVTDLKAIHRSSDGRILFSLKDDLHYIYSSSNGLKKLSFPTGIDLHLVASSDSVWASKENQLILLNLNGDIIQTYPLEENLNMRTIQQDRMKRFWILSG